ncbi:MAG: PKD domain-containing protein, partial [bacterium]|nr:PKD domain-containing protein [bacterium]
GPYTNGPMNIVAGSSVALNWTSVNMTSCTASAVPVNSQWTSAATSGTRTISNILVSTVFSLSCSGPGGNRSDTVTVNVNSRPTAGSLNLNNSDFCDSPGYFFSWTFSDPDLLDRESRFDFQVDDSGATFPSSEVDRSYSGLSNPNPAINNQAVIVLLTAQADYLTYNRTYNWRVQVYDNQIPPNASGWVNGVPFSFPTPSHRVPVCDFTPPPPPTNLNPGESIIFTDTSNCYDASGNIVSCIDWSWTFTGGSPADSTEQNPTTEFSTSGSKNITLIVWDSFGSFCSTTKQITVSLPLPKWKEIRPW